MNESLMYGSVDQAGERFPVLSSTTWIADPNASGDLASTLAGVILSEQVEFLNEESSCL